MTKFNNQFATQKLRQEVEESSMTGTGATFTPGTGEQTAPKATKKVVRKKVKKEGKAIPSDWTDAPSIPNRPSKGGFIYKQLYENTLEERSINEALEVGDRVKVVYGNEFYGETGTIDDIVRGFVSVEMDGDGGVYSMHSSDVEKIEDEEDDEPVSDYIKYRQDPDYYEKDYQEKGTSDYFQRRSLDESYSRFKNETKTRSKTQQMHEAIKLAEKKIMEANKILEYTSQLRTDLFEGGEAKYNKHTEAVVDRMHKRIAEAYKKIKQLK